MKEIHYGLVNEYLKVLIKNTYFMFKLKLKILCACSNTNPTTLKYNQIKNDTQQKKKLSYVSVVKKSCFFNNHLGELSFRK